MKKWDEDRRSCNSCAWRDADRSCQAKQELNSTHPCNLPTGYGYYYANKDQVESMVQWCEDKAKAKPVNRFYKIKITRLETAIREKAMEYFEQCDLIKRLMLTNVNNLTYSSKRELQADTQLAKAKEIRLYNQLSKLKTEYENI